MTRSIVLLSGGIDSTVVAHMCKARGTLFRAAYIKHGKKRNERELVTARRLTEKLGVPLDIGDLSQSRAVVFGHAPGDPARGTEAVTVIDGDDTPPAEQNSEKGLSPFSVMLTFGLYYTHVVHGTELAIGLVAHQTKRRPRFREYLDELARIDAVLNPDIEPVSVASPLIEMSKGEIIRAGVELDVDFSRTWSCLRWGDHHCGECLHCGQRKAGFVEAGLRDPTEYLA